MMNIQDWVAIGFLVILEGLLSFDNALALAAMVKHLPQPQQKKALTYGIFGAFGFRFLALSFITIIMQASWIKFVGGGYLIWMGVSHFFGNEGDDHQPEPQAFSYQLWKTIIYVELTDIAFSVDSILASVAVSNKFYVVLTGGILGIIMMRFVSSLFIRLLDIFPKLEQSAYLLILIVGMKMVLEGFHFEGVDFNSSSNPVFWVFWSAMAISLASGFIGGGSYGQEKSSI